MSRSYVYAFVECLVLAAFSLLILYQSTQMQDFGESALSAGFFPFITASGFLLASIVLAVQTYRKYKKSSTEEETPEGAPPTGEGKSSLKVFVVFALAVVYAIILPILHFFLASVLFMIAFLILAGERRWYMIGLVAVGLSGSLQLIFGNLLQVMLP